MTTKQRAYLRSLANTLEPVLQLGKDGISDEVIKQLDDVLEARELVKVNVLKNAPYTAREACTQLCAAIGAEPVQVIGSRFVVYRESTRNKRIEL